jgi:hypothetical protein
MKKLVALSAAALLAGVSLASQAETSSAASTKAVEDTCKSEARKHHVSEDKMKDYLNSCIQKHTQANEQRAPAATPVDSTPLQASPDN